MARDKRPADEYSIDELEALLSKKKLEVHASRLQRYRETGRALPLLEGLGIEEYDPESQSGTNQESEQSRFDYKKTIKSVFNRLLLWIEIAAVFGMAFVFFKGFGLLQTLNQEVAEAIEIPTPSPTPLITAVVLPSGHTPPNSPGGAKPNDAEIPENLRPLVQSLPSLAAPTPGPQHAQQILIEALWPNPQPIVQGDGWEQLKKGVGQHIGSANPGEPGNLILSAHNDIFGELFRNLDRLRPGHPIKVSTSSREFTYIVTGIRVVQPTEVSAMDPTEKATITLISCYPYLVDSQRIVVFGELRES
ncbi:MAG: class D sortase [Anaerolineales bacterium]|nr:class D sortase [Anaerolineales bacterium]